MVDDLQPGEVVVAEKIDRISRLPLVEAERLVAAIRVKGPAQVKRVMALHRAKGTTSTNSDDTER